MTSITKDNINVHRPVLTEARAIMKLGLPVIASQLLQMSMGFVDTVMAGNLSPKALAAVAVGSSLLNPVFIFLLGILMAINPVVAHLFGGRQIKDIGRNVRQGLWMSQILAWPAFFLIRNLKPLLHLMNVEPTIIPIAQGYMNAISWGLPFISAYMALRFFNEAIGATKPGMYFALIGVIVNIAGNFVFMYGYLGFPAMGAVGTGWASALVAVVMFLGLLVYTVRRKSYKRFGIFERLGRPSMEIFRELIHIGLPNGMSAFMEVSMFALVTLLMGSIGTIAVAGHQIAINFCSITFMMPLGLSTAITVRIGQAMGRKKPYQARHSGLTGISLSVMIMTCTALIMWLIPEVVAHLYTQDQEVVTIAVSLLHVAAFFQISDGLQVSGLGALRGLKDTKIPMVVNLIAYWIIGLPLGYYLGITLDMGPRGLWIGLVAGLTAAAILHNTRFWILTKHFIDEPSTISQTPNDELVGREPHF